MNHASTTSCRYHVLARTPIATVRRCCHCACVSVDVGSTSLRFDDPAFRSLAQALSVAAAQLEMEANDNFDEILRRPHGRA